MIEFNRLSATNTHSKLAKFNHQRLLPDFIDADWPKKMQEDTVHLLEEGAFIEALRSDVQAQLIDMPKQPEAFMCWFESLKVNGPGQGDLLFPWLAERATYDEMCWFLNQEAAGEAGFDDLVALTQVKIPEQAKLEMARNFWDEMGRGNETGMHGPMLAAVVSDLNLTPTIDDTVWESLALANLMLGMASNRRYAYQSIGALGVVEMTAPTRVSFVNEGLKRLQIPFKTRQYFQLHATLDVKHSEAWNTEVIYSLIKSDPNIAKPIAEGALMRLECGAKCFARYRAHFGINAT